MGKMELRDPVGPSPPPYRQLPFIFESLTPFTKEQGSPDSHSNPGKVNCNQYLLTFPFLPPADSKAYLFGKPGRQEVEWGLGAGGTFYVSQSHNHNQKIVVSGIRFEY